MKENNITIQFVNNIEKKEIHKIGDLKNVWEKKELYVNMRRIFFFDCQ